MCSIYRRLDRAFKKSAIIGLLFLFLGEPAFARLSNDPDLGEQWYVHRIEAPLAWETSVGSRDVIVAVIDTGVVLEHPDLKPNLWRNARERIDGIDNDANGFVDDVFGWDFLRGVGAPIARNDADHSSTGYNHATIISGLVGGRGANTQGIAGVAWRVTILPLVALDGFGDGEAETVAKAVDYAVMMGADIINLSLVGAKESEELTTSLRRAWDAGVLVIAAVGNQLRRNVRAADLGVRPEFPACTDVGDAENWILGVAATDRDDRKAWFSNYGGGCVDISAPGDDLWSTQWKGIPPVPYGGGWQGTSIAAPLVAGAAALLKSANPTLTNRELRDLLLGSAERIDHLNPLFAGKLGVGRLNVGRAMVRVRTDGRVNRFGTVIVEAKAGTRRTLAAFNRYAASVALPTNVDAALGIPIEADLDGDGTPERIVPVADVVRPRVEVKDANGFVYDTFELGPGYRRVKFSVGAGDIDGDGYDEVVVSPSTGSGAVRVLSWHRVRDRELVLPTAGTGYRIAVGDLDADDVAEIISVTAFGSSATLRIFDGTGIPKSVGAPVGIPRGATIRLAAIKG